jgi:hypothetical protein
MADFLTYYYEKGSAPFRSLSDLADDSAVRIMNELYGRNRGNILFERFSDPAAYLKQRRETEAWVRSEFAQKGGRPVLRHPVSMVLGRSRWIEDNAPNRKLHGEIRIPAEIFSEADVSFTFPDSMVSFWLGTARPAEYYLPEFHGKVFTKSGILRIVEEKGLPEDGWTVRLPPDTGPYIEAQVWNRIPLERYFPRSKPAPVPGL